MKLADQLKWAMTEGIPKGAKMDKTYKRVIVDEKVYHNMHLKYLKIKKNELAFFDDKGERHIFNFIEQEIKLK